jgi:hypothetical protein
MGLLTSRAEVKASITGTYDEHFGGLASSSELVMGHIEESMATERAAAEGKAIIHRLGDRRQNAAHRRQLAGNPETAQILPEPGLRDRQPGPTLATAVAACLHNTGTAIASSPRSSKGEQASASISSPAPCTA